MSLTPARVLGLSVAAATAVVAVACAKVPYTGRKQVNLVPDVIMRTLGAQSYTSMLDGKPIDRTSKSSQVLDRVGGRISTVAKAPDFEWEYALIEEDTINAWCMPGGKIGFYTGILPVLENESGMAFVMGHEVGHAVAKHGSERLSQQLAVFGGLAGLELVLSEKTKLSAEQRGIVLGALGVGAQVGILLPFSRQHEKEADVIGLMYMSGAGYPPEESIAVWDRMAAASGAKPPVFLSTHPSEGKRQENLRAWMDQAQKRYARNRVAGDPLRTLWSGSASSSTSTKGSSADTVDEPVSAPSGNRSGTGG